MSNKDQNKYSWKNRLDELDNLPGELLTAKDMAWEKLHDRLREKPARKRTYWYWAAASLFILAVLPWAFNDKKPDMIGQSIVSSELPLISIATQTITGKITKEKKGISEQPVKEKKVPVITSIDKDVALKPKQVISTKEIRVDPVELKVTTDPIIDIVKTLPVNDTSKISITAVAPKRTLRVVHINEITSQGETGITETDNNGIGFRRFIRHSNKDVSVGNPPPVNPAEHILIKNLNAQN